MTGIIVTGHGTFATGLTSGLKLLAGELKYYESVDFDPEDSLEVLEGNLRAAIGRLKETGSVLILADLTGGSPFNVSIRLKLEGSIRAEVIGGANLPILLDAYISRDGVTDVTVLAKASLEAGKAQTLCYSTESGGNGGKEEEDIEFDE